MALHPEYPELVKTALASDVYWRHDYSRPRLSQTDEIAMGIRSIRNASRIGRDTEIAARIGSVLMSLQDGDTVEPIPWGEPLPIPHGRQVIAAIQDSRVIYHRASPLYQYLKFETKRTNKKHVEEMRTLKPDFKLPTFEDQLEEVHASILPFASAAKIIRPYNNTRVAVCRREALYLHYDEQGKQFVGMPSIFGLEPSFWRLSDIIPLITVGAVYKRSLDGMDLGRIVSAHLVETHSVTWKTGGNSSSGTKKDRRTIKGLRSRVIHSPA